MGSPNYLLTMGANTERAGSLQVSRRLCDSRKFYVHRSDSHPAWRRSACVCNGGTCVPQPSTTQRLDSLADRLMHRFAYRNFGNHESLVVSHSVTAGSSGGVRWYEIQNPSGTPVVAQQSTFAPDATYRWMPSIAMDQAGNLAVGYSKSSTTVSPSVAFAGRLATDPVSTLQAETIVVNGTGSQTSGLSRWGDYSAMTVDPVDDCTFWYTQEYMKTTGTFNWNTRIANFKFRNCGAQVTANPTSLTLAANRCRHHKFASSGNAEQQAEAMRVPSAVSVPRETSARPTTAERSLAGNSSCTINVTFTPTTSGTRTGTLTVTDSAGIQTVSLTGTGTNVGNVTLTPEQRELREPGSGDERAVRSR